MKLHRYVDHQRLHIVTIQTVATSPFDLHCWYDIKHNGLDQCIFLLSVFTIAKLCHEKINLQALLPSNTQT